MSFLLFCFCVLLLLLSFPDFVGVFCCCYCLSPILLCALLLLLSSFFVFLVCSCFFFLLLSSSFLFPLLNMALSVSADVEQLSIDDHQQHWPSLSSSSQWVPDRREAHHTSPRSSRRQPFSLNLLGDPTLSTPGHARHTLAHRAGGHPGNMDGRASSPGCGTTTSTRSTTTCGPWTSRTAAPSPGRSWCCGLTPCRNFRSTTSCWTGSGTGTGRLWSTCTTWRSTGPSSTATSCRRWTSRRRSTSSPTGSTCTCRPRPMSTPTHTASTVALSSLTQTATTQTGELNNFGPLSKSGTYLGYTFFFFFCNVLIVIVIVLLVRVVVLLCTPVVR